VKFNLLDFQKPPRQAHQNRYRKPKGTYRWVVAADGVNGYATIAIIKRV